MPLIDASKKLSPNDLADLFHALTGPAERRLAVIAEHTDLPSRTVIRAVATRYAEEWVRETFPDRSLPDLRIEEADLDPGEEDADLDPEEDDAD